MNFHSDALSRCTTLAIIWGGKRGEVESDAVKTVKTSWVTFLIKTLRFPFYSSSMRGAPLCLVSGLASKMSRLPSTRRRQITLDPRGNKGTGAGICAFLPPPSFSLPLLLVAPPLMCPHHSTRKLPRDKWCLPHCTFQGSVERRAALRITGRQVCASGCGRTLSIPGKPPPSFLFTFADVCCLDSEELKEREGMRSQLTEEPTKQWVCDLFASRPETFGLCQRPATSRGEANILMPLLGLSQQQWGRISRHISHHLDSIVSHLEEDRTLIYFWGTCQRVEIPRDLNVS